MRQQVRIEPEVKTVIDEYSDKHNVKAKVFMDSLVSRWFNVKGLPVYETNFNQRKDENQELKGLGLSIETYKRLKAFAGIHGLLISDAINTMLIWQKNEDSQELLFKE